MSDEEISDSQSQGSDEAPELLEARDDFAAMMNEFLGEYEILGGKMKPRLEGDTNIEKLDTIRKAFGSVIIHGHDEQDDGDIPIPVDIDDVKDTWDCETVLSRFCLTDYHVANSCLVFCSDLQQPRKPPTTDQGPGRQGCPEDQIRPEDWSAHRNASNRSEKVGGPIRG